MRTRKISHRATPPARRVRRAAIFEPLEVDPTGQVIDHLGHRELDTSTSPRLAGGDLDARWDQAEAAGEETVGGSAPTPGQDLVDEIGRAVGVTYQEGEELKVGAKEEERDRHRWELDPASSEDYRERLHAPEESDEILAMTHSHHRTGSH